MMRTLGGTEDYLLAAKTLAESPDSNARGCSIVYDNRRSGGVARWIPRCVAIYPGRKSPGGDVGAVTNELISADVYPGVAFPGDARVRHLVRSLADIGQSVFRTVQ